MRVQGRPAGDRGVPGISFDDFWATTLAELMSRPPAPEVDPLPIRSTEFSDGYSVKLTSLGDYRLFGYYSVPHGGGPYPAIYHAPGYASVVQVPPYYERQRHVCLSLCARGQRLSDKPYAAAFPGLLTDRIDQPLTWPLRGWVADTCRGIDFLKLRSEVDAKRMVVVGSDMALFAAAFRPEVRAVVISDPTSITGHEEIDDFVRTYPDRADAARATLALFDPMKFASRIKADVLISCGGAFTPDKARKLAEAIGPNASVYERTGKGYLDRVHVEGWIAEHGGDVIAPRS